MGCHNGAMWNADCNSIAFKNISKSPGVTDSDLSRGTRLIVIRGNVQLR